MRFKYNLFFTLSFILIAALTSAQKLTTTQGLPQSMQACNLQTNIILQLNPTSCGATDGFAVINVISGGQAPYTYSWNTTPTQTDSQLVAVSAGVYICFVKDALGCTTTDTVSLTDASPTTSLVSVTSPTCFGYNNGSLHITAPPTSSVIWNNNPLLKDTVLTGLTAGAYIGVITDAGCASNIIVQVPSKDSLIGTVSIISNVLCKGGSNGSVTAAATGGNGGYVFNWLGGPVNTPSWSGLTAANNYKMEVVDQLGCRDTAYFTITEPAAALLADSATAVNPTCFGGNNGSAQVSVTGGTTPYAFAWLNATGTLNTVSNLTQGNYTAVVTDANGCKDSAYFILTQPAKLIVTLTVSNSTICSGNSTTITASASGGITPYAYLWASGQTSNAITVNPSASTTFTANVVDNNNCAAFASTAITVVSSPTISLIDTDTLCVGGSKKVTATGGSSYSWYPSLGLSSITNGTIIASPATNTKYYVLASNTIGCTSLDSIYLVIDNSLNATFSYAPEKPETTTPIVFTNTTAGTNLTYSWNFGDNTPINQQTSPEHQFLFEGEYAVVLTAFNKRGCKDTSSTKIIIHDTFDFEVPNIFSPNGDNINDAFKFIKAKGIKELSCSVFNRYGIQVYTFLGAKGQWEGFNQMGEKCPEGTYFYTISLTTSSGEKKSYSGYLTLIR